MQNMERVLGRDQVDSHRHRPEDGHVARPELASPDAEHPTGKQPYGNYLLLLCPHKRIASGITNFRLDRGRIPFEAIGWQ